MPSQCLSDIPPGMSFEPLLGLDAKPSRQNESYWALHALDGLKVVKGRDDLALYQFNTMTAEHYFCRVCGIYTHHRRRSNPNEYGYNVACLDGVNPFELKDVPVGDGINHPSDREGS